MKEENVVRRLQIGDYTIKIMQDVDADSPDTWGDDDVFLVYDHRQFYVERKGFEPKDIAEYGKSMYNGYHVFPVYAYIHSGVALSVGDHNFPDARWDVSMSGFMLVHKQKGWSWRRDKALKIAEAECETWNEYLQGNVYGYVIEKNGQEFKHDSCWGYYGDYETSGVIEDAKSVVEGWQKQDEAEQKKAIDYCIENNALIAEFADYYQKNGLWYNSDGEFVGHYLKFHISWDCLMPVVQKAKDIMGCKAIDDCTKEEWIATTSLTRLLIGTDIVIVWKALIKYITWYNSQKI